MIFQESRKSLANFFNSVKKEDMEDLLEDLLTPAEIVEISERINIFNSLQQGNTQRKIAADLGISVTTVSRGARVLKFGKGCINKYTK